MIALGTSSRWNHLLFALLHLASLVAQTGRNVPAKQETWVRSLGWEDPLEKERTTYSSILAWRILRTGEPGGLQSMRSQRVGHDWVMTNTFYLLFHLTECFQGSSLLQQVSEFHCFLRPNNIPLCGYTTSYLSTHLSVNIWVISIFWLSWLMLLWIWLYQYVWVPAFNSLGCILKSGTAGLSGNFYA